MVAMNPQSYGKDLKEIVPGGWLLYDSTMPRIWQRQDINVLPIPIAKLCAEKWSNPRQRQLFKNMVYVGAVSALLDMDLEDEIRVTVTETGPGRRVGVRSAAGGPSGTRSHGALAPRSARGISTS